MGEEQVSSQTYDREPEQMTPGRGVKRPKERPAARVALRMVSLKGEAALVEYAEAGRAVRVTIPADLVADDLTADPAELARGVPYGVAWEKAAVGQATPERIADALRNAGIWTAEDLKARPKAALGALQAAYGVDLAALMQYTTEESHG